MMMSKIYWLLVLVFPFVFSGCGDDEGGIAPPSITTDIIAPQITIHSPRHNETYLAIGTILIDVSAIDNNSVKDIRLFLADPSDNYKPIDISEDGRVEDGPGEHITQFFKPIGAFSGEYLLIVEAEDFNKNVATQSVVIHIIAEELSELDFNTAFKSTGWYEVSGGSDTELDLDGFNLAFYSIVNKYQWDYLMDPSYVNEFGEDFGGHSQLWGKWDVNKDDYLEYSEFEKGMEDLKFFTDWDVNKNGSVSKDELAYGVGTLWDVNKDNVVTAAEFEQKLRKYFLFD